MRGQSFAYPIFSLNLYIRGFTFDMVSKISEYICLLKQVQTFAWLSPSACEAVQAGSCAVMFYTQRQLKSESAMQIKGDFQLPAARIWRDLCRAKGAYGCLCPYVERCQMWTQIQLIFTRLLQLPLPPQRPPYSPPPSWSCWEILD